MNTTRNWPAESEASGLLDDLTVDDLVYVHTGLLAVQKTTLEVAEKALGEGDVERATRMVARASDIDVLVDRVTAEIEKFDYFFDESGRLMKKVQEVA